MVDDAFAVCLTRRGFVVWAAASGDAKPVNNSIVRSASRIERRQFLTYRGVFFGLVLISASSVSTETPPHRRGTSWRPLWELLHRLNRLGRRSNKLFASGGRSASSGPGDGISGPEPKLF